MKKTLRYAALCLVLFAPFCANKRTERLSISIAEISLAIQAETLQAAVCQRLAALEAVQAMPAPKIQTPKRVVVAINPTHEILNADKPEE